MDRDDHRDISYLICGAIALIGVERLWATRLRPFLSQHFGLLHDDAGAPVWRVGPLTVSSIDLIATAIIALAALVTYRVVRYVVRAELERRRRDAERRELDDEAALF